MKLIIIFTAFAIFAADACYIDPKCDDVVVDSVHYAKETLIENKDSPYQLAIDYRTNTLFFSYYNNSNGQVFSSEFLSLKTNEHNIIPGISKGFASTVDSKNNIVYLGGVDGLYKFDYETKTAKHIDGTKHSIWQMFFKNDVYYSTYPEEQVYVFKDGKSEIVPELANTRAMLIALNNELDFFFANSSGVFKMQKLSGKTILLGDYIANAMTADIDGNVYFSTPDGIYIINKADKIDEIASIPDTYGVAIESDGNLIYASRDAIIRLNPTKSPCFKNEKECKE